jgi:hypothetical protein
MLGIAEAVAEKLFLSFSVDSQVWPDSFSA